MTVLIVAECMLTENSVIEVAMGCKYRSANSGFCLCNWGAARTGVAEHKVEHVEVLGAEDVAVAAAVVAVAVHYGSGGGGEHEHVDALGHVAFAHKAPLHQAQCKGLQGARRAVDGQLHAPRLLLHQRCQAACAWYKTGYSLS